MGPDKHFMIKRQRQQQLYFSGEPNGNLCFSTVKLIFAVSFNTGYLSLEQV